MSVMVQPPKDTPHVHGAPEYGEIVLSEEDPWTEWIAITPTGAEFRRTGKIPLKVAEGFFTFVGEIHGALPWVLGDVLNHVEFQYGETYTQFMELTGYSYYSLAQYKRVGAAIPPKQRRPDVSWSAHQIVASVRDDEKRATLLDQFTSGEIEDYAELRDAVRTIRAVTAGEVTELLPLCPLCGGKTTPVRCKGCGFDFPAALWLLKDLMAELEGIDTPIVARLRHDQS